MQQSSLQSARKLPLPIRIALEHLLGRALRDNEAVSVRAYEPNEGPSPEQQRVIANDLRRYFAQIDEKTKDLPETEQDEILEEAIRSVRPDYRLVR